MVRSDHFRFHPLAACVAAAIMGFVSLHATAQTAEAQPTADSSPSNAAGSQGASATPTIRAFSNLVVLDVVVTDSHGNPVHGLKASDFTLLENKKQQLVRHFEEHSALPASQIAPAPAPNLPPGLFTNQESVPSNGPVNVLLLDYLNTPLSAQANARKQLLDYLSHAQPGTRIAIFALTTKLGMLHGFTSDMSALKAAMDIKKGGAPRESDLMYDTLNGAPGGDTSLSTGFANTPSGLVSEITPAIAADINRFEAINNSFQIDLRSRYTLYAFDTLARYLVGIPGRKNVIWFSGSFPLDVEPDASLQDPMDTDVRNDEEIRITDNLLTRAQVALYPIDARGVVVDPSFNFSSDNLATNTVDAGSPDRAGAFLQQHAQENLTMIQMAEDTGGEALINTNDLTQAIAKAVQNGSNYYTLSYAPSNHEWDARFRSIKVQVNHPGVKLAYRTGYYALDPNDPTKWIAGLAATAGPAPATMTSAMIHGGPQESEILFKVRVRPSDTPPAEMPLRSNQTNPDPKVRVEGPYKSYGIDLVPDPRAVNCKEDSSGFRHCSIEVWTFVYNTDGEKLITVSNRLRANIKPEDYEKMIGTPERPGVGIAFHQEISVPVRGHYFLRTAIHDLNSDRVGSLEIPVGTVAHLDPLQSMPAQPAATPYNSAPRIKGDGAATAAPTAGTGNGADQRSGPALPIDGSIVGPPKPASQGTPTLKHREPPPATPTPPQ